MLCRIDMTETVCDSQIEWGWSKPGPQKSLAPLHLIPMALVHLPGELQPLRLPLLQLLHQLLHQLL